METDSNNIKKNFKSHSDIYEVTWFGILHEVY